MDRRPHGHRPVRGPAAGFRPGRLSGGNRCLDIPGAPADTYTTGNGAAAVRGTLGGTSGGRTWMFTCGAVATALDTWGGVKARYR